MPRSYKGSVPTVAESAYIDATATVIGDVVLAHDVSIWPMVVVRGDVNFIRIGARTNIQDGCVLHVTSPSEANPEGFGLRIGADVTVGHRCILHACTVSDRVLVGMGATVMDGAVVESDVIVGAGALVPPGRRLESGHLYVGSPAEKKRPLRDGEKAHLVASAAHYAALKDNYRG